MNDAELTVDFQGILNDVAKQYAEQEVYDNWSPPNGSYVGVVGELKCGVSGEGDKRYGWWKIPVTLLHTDPELDGRETSFFYKTRAMGFLKADVSTLAGKKVDDVNEATRILASAAGTVISFDVTRTKPKNIDREFVNTKITGVQTDTPSEELAPSAEPAEQAS